MGFLLGHVIGAVIGGIAVVRILEFLFGGLPSGVLNIIRPLFFVGTVTAVTTKTGISKFDWKIGKVQRIFGAIGDRLESDTKSKSK